MFLSGPEEEAVQNAVRLNASRCRPRNRTGIRRRMPGPSKAGWKAWIQIFQLFATLFEKIGIDPENITWFTAPDGTSFASGGLHCKSEDLLRLMRLYLHHGKWDGEEILSNSLSISRPVRKSIPRIFSVTQSSTASATMCSDMAA